MTVSDGGLWYEYVWLWRFWGFGFFILHYLLVFLVISVGSYLCNWLLRCVVVGWYVVLYYLVDFC